MSYLLALIQFFLLTIFSLTQALPISMNVFKFMCARLSEEEDTDTLENDSQIPENCEGGNKELTLSDDHLSASNRPNGTITNGDNKIIEKSVTELGKQMSNTIPPIRTDDKLTHLSDEAIEEKRGPQSFEILSWEPRLFLFRNFLSQEECEHLIKLAKPHLQRSLLIDRQTGKPEVSGSRTSFGASLRRGYDKIIRNIENRIAEATFIPVEHGEPLHVLRYEIGQKIEPHHDYLNNMPLQIVNGGQRIATFLMYLSAVEEGGETIFPLGKGEITTVPWCDGISKQFRTGVVVRPKMGDAVLFWSTKPDGSLDPSSQHCGCPVIKGNKWCCTKWMREKEYKI